MPIKGRRHQSAGLLCVAVPTDLEIVLCADERSWTSVGDAEGVSELCRRLRPGTIIIDVDNVDIYAPSLVRKLRQTHVPKGATQILTIGDFRFEGFINQLLDAGADAYHEKRSIKMPPCSGTPIDLKETAFGERKRAVTLGQSARQKLSA